MKNVILLLILFVSNLSISQGPPPPMAMPSNSNQKLIDEIIEITRYEIFFKEYCSKKVITRSQEEEWDRHKTTEIMNSINFEYYRSTIDNSFAFYTTEELKTLIEALKILNSNNKNNKSHVLMNTMTLSNLELHVESLLEGKYVIK